MKVREALQVSQGLTELVQKDISAKAGYAYGMMLSKLDACISLHDKQRAKFLHRYGLDQAAATLNGIVKDEKAPKLREIDQESFQEEYQQLLESDAQIEDIGKIKLSEIEGLMDSDGKPLKGVGVIAAKLAPILEK